MDIYRFKTVGRLRGNFKVKGFRATALRLLFNGERLFDPRNKTLEHRERQGVPVVYLEENFERETDGKKP